MRPSWGQGPNDGFPSPTTPGRPDGATPRVRRVSSWGLAAALVALSASIGLSYFGDASRRGVDVCSSAGTSPLVGYSLLALVGAAVVAIPGLWATVKVFRADAGSRSVAPRAAAVVLIVLGLPVALLSLLASAFSYACLF